MVTVTFLFEAPAHHYHTTKLFSKLASETALKQVTIVLLPPADRVILAFLCIPVSRPFLSTFPGSFFLCCLYHASPFIAVESPAPATNTPVLILLFIITDIANSCLASILSTKHTV